MSYRDERRRYAAKQLVLPPLPPDEITAGLTTNTERYRRSVEWMKLYHQRKKEADNVKDTEEDREADGLGDSQG